MGVEFFTGTSFEERLAADLELISLGWLVLDEILGSRQGISLQLNTLGDAESRARYNVILSDYLRACRSQLSEEGQARLDRGAVLRILDSKQDEQVAQGAPSIHESLNAQSQAYWDALRGALEQMHVPFAVTPSLVRGLDYYQDTVFEFVHKGASLGAQQGTILAGGRYDGLLPQVARDLDAEPHDRVAAAGWAMGVDRVTMLLGPMGEEDSVGQVCLLCFLPVS